MFTDREYFQVIKEIYDISTLKAKKQLLFCNEAKKASTLDHIVTKLYKHIQDKITEIDFGSIPKSKGDITKIENYEQMMDCLNTIADLVKEYKDPTKTVQEIYTAIDNVNIRKREFTKAFALNIEFPIMLYNTTVLSIVSAISLLITSSIEFIKNGHDSFEASFDRAGYMRSKDHLLYEYVSQFNSTCANHTIDKLINGCIKNNLVATKESAVPIREDYDDIGDIIDTVRKAGPAGAVLISLALPGPFKIVGIIGAIGLVAYNFIKLINKCIVFYLKFTNDISLWFAIQAEFLRINAENLKYRDDEHGEKHKKEVYKQQMKWVARFNKISNAFALKDSKVQKEMKREEQEYKQLPPEEENEDTSNDNDTSNDGDLF